MRIVDDYCGDNGAANTLKYFTFLTIPASRPLYYCEPGSRVDLAT